jgi:hypothetical protein
MKSEILIIWSSRKLFFIFSQFKYIFK